MALQYLVMLKYNELRYIVVLFTLFFGSFSANGQLKFVNNLTYFDDRKLHFGFYLGINTMDYRTTNYNNVFDNPVFANNPGLKEKALNNYGNRQNFAAEVYSVSPGFTVGGVVNYRLNRDLDFRFTPGMSLGNRQFRYFIDIKSAVFNQSQDMDEATYLSTPSSYIDLPVGIRYKGFRHNNLRPYIYMGASYRFDLENKRISERVVHLNKSDEYAELGLGLDSYLEFFRFSLEFRFSYGLKNLIRHDADMQKPVPYYGFIFKELNSNIFTLILNFE